MALGLTQAQLAGRLGQSQHYVSRTEIGDRRLDVFELDALCAALDTTLEEVWSHLRPLMSLVPAPRPLSSPSVQKPAHLVARAHINSAPKARAWKNPVHEVGADAARRVERARVLLEREEDEPLSIEAVAAHVGWSADHLRRMFRAVFHVSPHRVQVSARLRRARALLLEEGMPVSRVAGLCGFINASHFAQAFKREFGLSPREFRTSTSNRALEHEAGDICGD